MSLLTWFFVLFALTVVLLLSVLATGFRASRRLHLTLVPLTVVSLLVTIFVAERLGRRYDLKAAGLITPVHLTLAKVTTLCFLLPIVTGFLTLAGKQVRKLHGIFALGVTVLTVLTAATGTWMLVKAPPLGESQTESVGPSGPPAAIEALEASRAERDT